MPDSSDSLRGFTLRQLRVFGAVARACSFTRAARELHLTQPAVSMQVRELEAACGLALFERSGRGVRLTEAGREMAHCAEGILEQLRLARERLDDLRGLRKGLLRLGAVSTAKYFAPALLAEFQGRHPDVAVRFTVGNRDEMVRQLAEDQSDLVIMGRPPRELETVAEPFAPHPLVVIAAPGHPLAARRRILLRRLAQENFLIREPGSGTRAAMERVFRERGVRYRASMEVSSNETIKQAVSAGMGVSFISAHTIALDVEAGKLAVLDVAGLPLVRQWHMIAKRKRLAPIAAAFRAFVLEHGARIIDRVAGPALRPSSPRPRTSP